MSLSKWSGIHPYVAERVRYLLSLADRHGGRYTVLSGGRSLAKQWELYQAQTTIPAAFPGCSQHQYGLAMDVKFTDPEWQEWYLASARKIGLQTVSFDPNHIQAISRGSFYPFVNQAGLCPNPYYKNKQRMERPERLCPPGQTHVEVYKGVDYCYE